VDPTSLKEGELLINLAANIGLEVADSCPGSVTMTRSGSELIGEALCAFSGDLAEFLPGDQTVTMVGTIAGTDVTGTLELSAGGQKLPIDWLGTIDESSGQVLGSFNDSGSFEVEGFPISVAYSGGFKVTPAE
jgi:hypothetical protein